MAIQHINRKGEAYYLHTGKTKTGKPNYYFSRKPSDAPVEALPDGFEIHESPENAMVVLRKRRETATTAFEREMVCEAVRRHAGLEHFIVDAEENSLTVYVAHIDDLSTTFEVVAEYDSQAIQQRYAERYMRQARYTKMMRFVLLDAASRLFFAQRWCFLGSIDHWLDIGRPAPLASLLDAYAKHLGKESFFDLL